MDGVDSKASWKRAGDRGAPLGQLVRPDAADVFLLPRLGVIGHFVS